MKLEQATCPLPFTPPPPAFGVAGMLLLHFIPIIGPMARLDRRRLPFLYHRRHLGLSRLE